MIVAGIGVGGMESSGAKTDEVLYIVLLRWNDMCRDDKTM